MPNESIGCVRACIFGQLAVKGVEPTTHSSIDAAGGGDGIDVVLRHRRCGERSVTPV